MLSYLIQKYKGVHPKVLVLTMDSKYSKKIILDMLKYMPKLSVIFSSTYVGNKGFIKSLKYIIKNKLYLFFMSKALNIYIYKFFNKSLEKILKERGVKIYHTKNINNEVELVKKIKPNIIISIYFNQHIGKEILKIPIYAINVHPAMLPKYRGMTPYIWAFYNKEKMTASTLHLISEKFDEGDIINHTKLDARHMRKYISDYINPSNMFMDLSKDSCLMLKNFYFDYLRKKIRIIKQKGKSSYYSYPTNKVMAYVLAKSFIKRIIFIINIMKGIFKWGYICIVSIFFLFPLLLIILVLWIEQNTKIVDTVYVSLLLIILILIVSIASAIGFILMGFRLLSNKVMDEQ